MRKLSGSAYIVAVRRSVLGRPGGLHAKRRIEELAQPVIAAALEDAGVSPELVNELILGNVSGDGNPARIVGLVAGLSETSTAYSIDRACVSGLDAILAGIRSIRLGEADVVVAGGAESLSTAPWRVARPRTVFQQPRFYGPVDGLSDAGDDLDQIEAMEALIRSHAISRGDQDCYAMETVARARAAYDARQFVGEIVPMRLEPGEAIDEWLDGRTGGGSMEQLEALIEPGGTITAGNVAGLSDGAAFAVIVSDRMYRELGAPQGLKLVASSTVGAAMSDPGEALVRALGDLAEKTEKILPDQVGVFEINEASAGEVLLARDRFQLNADLINPAGGAIARGHAPGASGAVLLARLFTAMVRNTGVSVIKYGVAALGGRGGQGIAALFEAVDTAKNGND